MDLDGRIKEFHAGHSPSFLGPSMPRLSLVSRSPTIDSDMPNTKWRFRATGSSNPIQLVRKGHRAKYWIRSLFPPPLPGERAVMQTPTPLPSPSPGNTSCPGSRLLPCWPWTAQNSTLSLHVLETLALSRLTFFSFFGFLFASSSFAQSFVLGNGCECLAGWLAGGSNLTSGTEHGCISICNLLQQTRGKGV